VQAAASLGVAGRATFPALRLLLGLLPVHVVVLGVEIVVQVELFGFVLVVVINAVRRRYVIVITHELTPGSRGCAAVSRVQGLTLRCQTDAMLRPAIAVVGPTAAGKSELSLALARALGGEVVNADSMQLYRGMDIGTAKLIASERSCVPHHLLDIWPVTQTASVSEYQLLARAAIADIRDRDRTPILVGGSGLYVRAALDNLQFPGTDPDLRARLEGELAEVGPAELHARLRAVDPAAAAAILPSNGRRIVRALEVVQLTAQPFSATLPTYEYVIPAIQVGIERPRPELDRRVTERVNRMWQLGLVDEVRRLVPAGLRDGRTASRALAYAQVLRFLDGEWTEAEAAAQTILATKRFVRRQESWFRRDPRITWLRGERSDLAEQALAAIRAA
jgi:tRNA dimethylallyltransferase